MRTPTVSDLTFETHAHPARRTSAERAALMENPGFGKVFTDHMAIARYSAGRGWHDARITARAPIPLDPAAAVLHYAQEIFEGLKAYRTGDGGAALFRPEANALRFALCLNPCCKCVHHVGCHRFTPC